MLADAEMNIATVGGAGFKFPGAVEFEQRLVRRCKIGGATQEPGNVLSEDIEHLARRVASGDSFWIRWKAWQIAVPPGGQFPPLHLINLRGEIRETLAVFAEKRFPVAPCLAATLADARGKMLHDSVRHQELSIFRPVIGALDELHLVFTQGFAMGR